MIRDPLEAFIRLNREELDLEAPANALWGSIVQNLPTAERESASARHCARDGTGDSGATDAGAGSRIASWGARRTRSGRT